MEHTNLFLRSYEVSQSLRDDYEANPPKVSNCRCQLVPHQGPVTLSKIARGVGIGLLVVTLLLLLACVLGCAGAGNEEKRVENPAAKVIDRPFRMPERKLSLEKYHSIKTGMTYDEVKALIGWNGVEYSRVEGIGITIVGVAWSGDWGATIIVSFYNGRVGALQQSGCR